MASEQRDGFQKRGKFWSYRFRVLDPETGKKKEIRISGFPTKEEAKADRVRRESEAQKGRFVRPTKETVGDFFQAWIQTKVDKGDLKKATAHQYRNAIETYLIPHFGGLTVQELTPERLENFLVTLIQSGSKKGEALSHSTVRTVAIILSQGLDQAVRFNKINNNPMKQVEKPKGKTKTVSTYSASEIKALLECAKSHRLHAFIHLAIHTGARRGELLALRWSDFDPEKKTVSITKNRGMANGEIIEQNSTKSARGNRVVEISSEVVESLQSHAQRQGEEIKRASSQWKETGYIFTQTDGEPLYPTTPYAIFRKMIRELGLRPEPFHALRHTHATELLRAGYQPYQVASRLGDEVATVLNTYAHAKPEDDRELAVAFESLIKSA
jgi:integrase